MLNWDDLKYVLAMEQFGNLTKAAKLLKTNPTTVSRKLKRLSESYGQTLFTRSRTGDWSLTDQGRVFAKAARRCQAEIDSLCDDPVDEGPTEIKISTVDFIAEKIFAPNICELMTLDSQVSLTLDTQDKNVSLAFGEADLAIRLGRPKAGRLVVSKLTDIDMSVFSSGGVKTKDWVGLPIELDWVPEMKLGYAFFGRPPVMRMSTFASIRRAAYERGLSGIGPDVVFDGCCDMLKVRGQPMGTHREVWSVFHEERRQDKVLGQVRDWAKRCFATNQLNVAA